MFGIIAHHAAPEEQAMPQPSRQGRWPHPPDPPPRNAFTGQADGVTDSGSEQDSGNVIRSLPAELLAHEITASYESEYDRTELDM
jgi:hypothetical protein